MNYKDNGYSSENSPDSSVFHINYKGKKRLEKKSLFGCKYAL